MKRGKILILIFCIILFTGCTNKNNELVCETRDEISKFVLKFYFENGKNSGRTLEITTINEGIENPDLTEIAFNKINEIDGCIGKFIRNNDGSYTTKETCYFNEMTDDEIVTVYMQEREKLELSRKQIKNDHLIGNDNMKCK